MSDSVWLVKEPEVAKRLEVSKALLRKWRRLGKGPKVVRLGRAVRYSLADLAEFLHGRTR